MPIAFAPLLGLALGAVLAWIGASELSRDDGPIVASRAFGVVVAFVCLIWLPVVGYFVAFHGDWAYLYLVPWQRVPSAIDLGLVLLAGAAVVGGFAFAVRPVRKRHIGPVVALVVAPAGACLASLPVMAKRLTVSGTFAQFHGDFGTEPIVASTLGKGVLTMGAIVALAVAWSAYSLVRMTPTQPPPVQER